ALWPAVLGHLDDAGLLDRSIANSLNMGLTAGTVEALRAHTPAGAILLGFDPRDMSADGRVRMVRDGSGYLDKGLLDVARELGTGPLIDTAATPFDHQACETIRAIPVMKNAFGLPVGCAVHNTVESWLWMREYRRSHREAYFVCDMAANVLPLAFGADFLVYGPIDNAGEVFPMTAMVDKMVSEGAEDYFGVPPSAGHPRGRLP
ncbi:MAG: tetrahydromethanopterin S-methyltransferase subunit H, partial [Thermoplasmata archaeon]|nr:tetrahydromethanopterin S-methyltransferase subunit H [Thermoplasmata archaeon]